jgi:hypothetical protein
MLKYCTSVNNTRTFLYSYAINDKNIIKVATRNFDIENQFVNVQK